MVWALVCNLTSLIIMTVTGVSNSSITVVVYDVTFQVSVCVCMCVCVCACVCVCVSACMHICVCMHTYVGGAGG